MTDQQLPAMRDRGNRLRTQLEEIVAAAPTQPTLAEVIRAALKAYIADCNQKKNALFVGRDHNEPEPGPRRTPTQKRSRCRSARCR